MTRFWTAPNYARLPTTSGGGYFLQPGGSGVVQLSLEDYLNLCKALNAEPYFEVPVNITTTDASSLIDFLAGPSTSVGGQRRAALGQTAPWTSVFSQIHLSFCNECWNGSSFVGASLPIRANTSDYYLDYSTRASAVFAAMRSSASYTQNAFDLVMNAQTAINWTGDIAINRAHPDSIEIEDYSYAFVNTFDTDSDLWKPDFVGLLDQVTDVNDPTNFYTSVTD
jgi:alpha-L-arabinofuranosidase